LGEKGVQQTKCLDGLFHFFTVPPPPIKWLVDHNSFKLYSHQFVVKGILNKADGTWIDDKDWLRLSFPNYDVSYQITALTEKQQLSSYICTSMPPDS
jgi:hypothetical protein